MVSMCMYFEYLPLQKAKTGGQKTAKPEPTKEEKEEVGAAGEDKPVATPEAGEPHPIASPQEDEEGKKGKDGGISRLYLNLCM